MRKLASASLLAVALILVLAAPSLAGGGRRGHGGTRVFVSVGPRFWWGPYPYYGYPYSYYYYPYPYYVYTPPPVYAEPPVYVQQQPAPPTPPAPAAPEEGYWYYCPSAREYYPTAPTCSEAWIKVPPRQE
jgi:hypothetical protein